MNTEDISCWLSELVSFRDAELRELQELNRIDTKENDLYESKTAQIKDAISSISTNDNKCKLQDLTLDEAIEHALEVGRHMLEVGRKDDYLCAKNHLKLAEWLSDLKKYKSLYVSLCADFENYKKRVTKDKELSEFNAKKKFLNDAINSYDDMIRILENCEEKNSITDGFELVVKNMREMLKNNGCTQIECNVGDQFDVNFHEAVSTLDKNCSDIGENRIAKILSSGWLLDGKLMKAAKVVVYK